MAVVTIPVPATTQGGMPVTAVVSSPSKPGTTETVAATPGTVVAAATDEPATEPEPYYVFRALLLLIIGILGGWFIQWWWQPTPFVPTAGISLFAVFYILAQALERFSELGTHLFGRIGAATPDPQAGVETGEGKPTSTTKKDAVRNLEASIAEVMNSLAKGTGEAKVVKVAHAKRSLNQVRANRALIIWSFNSCLAALGCGLLGLNVLRTVGMQGVPIVLDIAITALAIGGGTKPLHDLISNLQQAKEKKEDPAKLAPTS